MRPADIIYPSGKIVEAPQMAWYVVVYFFAPDGQRDPTPERCGPFREQAGAEQFAIGLASRTNVAKVEIKYVSEL